MNNEQLGYGRATGKIILMGEHSVVYGEPAIAFPFEATAIITTITPAAITTVDCHYFSGTLDELPPQLRSVKEVIKQTLLHLSQTNASLKFIITSSIPPERGMGSSAAVATSIVRALFDYFKTPYSTEILLRLVNQAEKIAHGNPSGIDAAATSGSQPILFTKGQPLSPFPMNVAKAFLIVADTGIKGQTREAVRDIAELYQQDTAQISARIKELGQLTNIAKQAILTDDIYALGEAMDLAHRELQALSVSNQQLDRLVASAKEYQALGAKLTGGGRGGCMIALSDSGEQAVQIAAALENTGAKKTWIQSLEVKK